MLMLANVLVNVMAVFFVLVSVFMTLVILIQKPRGGGLSGAFGGGGGGGQQAVFGAKVGDFLTWFTVTLFVLFLLVAIGLVYATRAEVTGVGGSRHEAATVETDQSEDLAPPPVAPAPGGEGAVDLELGDDAAAQQTTAGEAAQGAAVPADAGEAAEPEQQPEPTQP
jgi:preprotein translocase subunit SecG